MESVYHSDVEGVILQGEVRQFFKRLEMKADGWLKYRSLIFKLPAKYLYARL